jgi:hypothetical protein
LVFNSALYTPKQRSDLHQQNKKKYIRISVVICLLTCVLTFSACAANGLMKLHGFNKTAALTTIWPDHPWDTSKLSSKAIKPPPEEVKSVLERWGDANNVKTPEDWRRTSLPTVLEAEHGSFLFKCNARA